MKKNLSWEQMYQINTTNFREVFGEILQELRKEKNYTQKELAKRLHVPPSTYANWEQGRRDPSIFDLFNIIWTLNIDANDLFNWEEIQNRMNIQII